jgi:hypothetical protein
MAQRRQIETEIKPKAERNEVERRQKRDSKNTEKRKK